MRRSDMSVTMDFFNDISFDIAKQKYYNANKVDAKMAEIKAAAREIIEENEHLRSELEQINASKEKMAQLLLEVQKRAESVEADAKRRAEEIIDDARHEAEGIIAQKNPAAAGLTASQMDAIDKLNKQLDDLTVAQATQVFRIKQALMDMALDK